MHAEAVTPRLGILPNALVLEVGGGHRPHPRVDGLTDKYLEDIELGGRLVTDCYMELYRNLLEDRQ